MSSVLSSHAYKELSILICSNRWEFIWGWNW